MWKHVDGRSALGCSSLAQGFTRTNVNPVVRGKPNWIWHSSATTGSFYGISCFWPPVATDTGITGSIRTHTHTRTHIWGMKVCGTLHSIAAHHSYTGDLYVSNTRLDCMRSHSHGLCALNGNSWSINDMIFIFININIPSNVYKYTD